MRSHFGLRLGLSTAAAAACFCVLGLLQTGRAQPKTSHEPFANSVAQQAEMVQLLKEINQQLKEQNALLRTGTLQVTVVPPAKPR